MYFVFPVVCACAAVVQLIITVAIAAAKPDFNTDLFILLCVLMFYLCLLFDIHLSFIDMQMYILFLYHQRKTRKNYRNSIKIYPFSLFVGMKEDEDAVFMCLG
jgi:hypothetical protein